MYNKRMHLALRTIMVKF